MSCHPQGCAKVSGSMWGPIHVAALWGVEGELMLWLFLWGEVGLSFDKEVETALPLPFPLES